MNIKKFFEVKKPSWLTVNADVDSAEIEAITRRADNNNEIDWESSRYLYWNKNPLKMLAWRIRNGKEGKRLLKRKQLEEGG